MIPTISKVDDKELRRKIKKLSFVTGRPMAEETRKSARRYSVTLAKLTAPFGDSQSTKQRGEATVRGDVLKVFRPESSVMMDLEKEQRSQLGFLLANKTKGVVRKYLASLGLNLEPVKTATRNKHEPERRKGRVPRGASARYMAPGNKVDKLITQKMKRVGKAKNGWAMCARQLGGTRGLAGWVSRKKGPEKTGSATTFRSDSQTSITIRNHVKYVSSLLSRKSARSGWRRELIVLKNEMDRAIRRAKK